MQKLYKIGDVSKICDISIKTLRYYEEFGLVKPVEVDKYTGYRYYSEANLETIYKIQILKELNFSLAEIKSFDEFSLGDKRAELERELGKLKEKINLISYIKEKIGGKNMKPFKNDENSIGKWVYVCSAVSKELFEKGDSFVDADVLLKEIYFLPNGEGYWIFKCWTKGEIYHYGGQVYKYKIEGNKLFVDVTNEDNEHEITLVFDRFDTKAYTKSEIERKDDTNMPFVPNPKAIGSWECVDFIQIADKETYKPRKNPQKGILKTLSLMANGDCFKEFSNGNIYKNKWTDGYILSETLASNFIIKTIDTEDYLIMDWKSGDYVYGGEIFGCYVFKKV
ncbi:MAG: MerR family transcriptional regulator [Clostridia bacterium]|nr:MerR family transcriptional regulator [Clostridia bacterium]